MCLRQDRNHPNVILGVLFGSPKSKEPWSADKHFRLRISSDLERPAEGDENPDDRKACIFGRGGFEMTHKEVITDLNSIVPGY